MSDLVDAHTDRAYLKQSSIIDVEVAISNRLLITLKIYIIAVAKYFTMLAYYGINVMSANRHKLR